MSRIGKKVIEVPAGVTVETGGEEVVVKGPKGMLRVAVPKGIGFERQDGRIVTTRASDEQAALHGLIRSLVANAVTGVSKGFAKHLDIVGIGYRAELKGRTVVLTLGFSHPIEFAIPQGIDIAVEKQTHLVVQGIDKRQVGEVAAELRGLRPPDPYKNKGVRYTGERLKKKVGKAVGATSAGAK